MRVTNSMIHTNAANALSKQQNGLSNVLEQLSSGKKINKASDDPVGASMAMEYQNRLNQLETNASSQGYAALAIDDYISTMGTLMTNLQGVLEKTIQVQNGSIQNSDWTKISSDITEKFNNLLAMANQKDSVGQYLFSGNMNNTPFTGDVSSPIVYHGDNGVREISIGDNQTIQMNIPGSFLFNSIPSRAEITYPATTTSKLTVTTPTLANPEGTLQITGTGTANFTDINGNTSSLTWSGNTLNIGSLSINIEGTPSVGDQFGITNPSSANLLTDVQELANITKNMPSIDSDKYKVLSRINELQQRLNNHFNNLSNHEVLMGGQANRIQNQQNLDEDYTLNIMKNKSKIEDTDYAKAATDMTAYQQALEATRSSYAKIASLSLFDYIK